MSLRQLGLPTAAPPAIVNDDVLASCGSARSRAGDVASSGRSPDGVGRTLRTPDVSWLMQDGRLSYAVLALGTLAIVVFLAAPEDSVWQMRTHLVPQLLATVCL